MQADKDIEKILLEYLPEDAGFAKTLLEAMRYSVLNGGKRVRPIIMRETYKLFEGESRAIEPFMAAIEMIHSYSLVHDDLPAMDNDTLRRGKVTTWKKYGESCGILAGDALLTYAFETASLAFELDNSANVGRSFKILAEKAGINGMCGGQAVDVELTGSEVPADALKYIYENKTGALIEASMLIGAILGGASDYEVSVVKQIAYCIGMAFQIQDDVLDIIASEEDLGKNVGSDMENDKYTYATIYGIEYSKNQVSELTNKAIELLDELPGNKKYFREFLRKLEKREN